MEFYKEGGDDGNLSTAGAETTSSLGGRESEPQRTSTSSPFGNILGGAESTSTPAPPPPPPSTSSTSKSKSKSQPKKRFTTFADFSRNASKESTPAHSGSDDDETENFFTGGEKSGLAVQNPDGAGPSSGRLINDIFRQAQRNQARGGTGPGDGFSDEDDDDDDDDEDFDGGSSFGGFTKSRKSGKGNKFSGTGFTLGSDEVPSRQIVDPLASLAKARPQRVIRQLTFWKDGFSVEDGPLYRYDDPENMAHLEAINSGKAPLSLLNVENGQGVDVRIIRKMDENFTPPKPKVGGYGGQGNRLGSPVPGELSASNSGSSSNANLPATVSASTSSPPTASSSSTTDSSGDALVQIRLGDGRALRARFQSTGPIQQLYDYVQTNQSPAETRRFILQTTFPNRELSETNVTLKAAGVVGAVVVQKWL